MIFTEEQKLKAIQREINYRKRVYARRMEEGKMTKELVDYELGVFGAIEADYVARAQKEKLL